MYACRNPSFVLIKLIIKTYAIVHFYPYFLSPLVELKTNPKKKKKPKGCFYNYKTVDM